MAHAGQNGDRPDRARPGQGLFGRISCLWGQDDGDRCLDQTGAQLELLPFCGADGLGYI